MTQGTDGQGSVTVPQAALLRLAYGALAAQVVYVAAKLGLADLLSNGSLTTVHLAAAVGVEPAPLRRILRSLVSLGVCTEATGDRFALAEMGEYLRSDHPDSLQPRVILNTEVLLPLWRELLHTLQTGESGPARVFGMSLYEHLAAHPEVGSLFDQTMAGYARYRLSPAVAAYDFSRFGTIIDVGGGNGALLIEILRTHPQPRGIVFDLPPVAERAREHLAASGLADRCSAMGGNALEMVPEGGDAYVLANFLITLNDERATGILQRCREAMAPSGTVLLIEWLAATGDEMTDPYTAWDTTTIDVAILVTNGVGGGRVRTREEFRTVLEAAGLALTAIIPTASSVSVIEARPTR
jgi:precorrin-6B methylase 2